MNVSDLIELLIAFKEKHGDLTVFSSSYFADPKPRLKKAADGFDDDWNMPESFCVIGEGN